MSPQMSWKQLSPNYRALVVAVGALDVGMRAWALYDLARRPAFQVRGPKPLWATALGTVNSAGLLPAAYLAWGRRSG